MAGYARAFDTADPGDLWHSLVAGIDGRLPAIACLVHPQQAAGQCCDWGEYDQRELIGYRLLAAKLQCRERAQYEDNDRQHEDGAQRVSFCNYRGYISAGGRKSCAVDKVQKHITPTRM